VCGPPPPAAGARASPLPGPTSAELSAGALGQLLAALGAGPRSADADAADAAKVLDFSPAFLKVAARLLAHPVLLVTAWALLLIPALSVVCRTVGSSVSRVEACRWWWCTRPVSACIRCSCRRASGVALCSGVLPVRHLVRVPWSTTVSFSRFTPHTMACGSCVSCSAAPHLILGACRRWLPCESTEDIGAILTRRWYPKRWWGVAICHVHHVSRVQASPVAACTPAVSALLCPHTTVSGLARPPLRQDLSAEEKRRDGPTQRPTCTPPRW
jgi:hypothetical protein